MKWLAIAIVAASFVLVGGYILVESGVAKEDKQRVCVERAKQKPGVLHSPRDCIRWDYG